jgi:hypothetical protein
MLASADHLGISIFYIHGCIHLVVFSYLHPNAVNALFLLASERIESTTKRMTNERYYCASVAKQIIHSKQ